MLLLTVAKAQEKIAENARLQRLTIGLTQQGLAERSGVALPTLRKFEQKGLISLEAFLKLQMVLGGLENFVKAIELNHTEFSSIDEVLKADKKPIRKRGSRR
ncbi:MAG: transcriptional regulator [Proteobacteria bacterium]|nr:transcriptional regulator [Pseudomonadota bacterium]